jgi:adenosylmethionine-8-amino-7-oxononanoate aminotransferase
LANLRVIEREGLVARAAMMGDRLRVLLDELTADDPAVSGHRVVGLLAGVDVSPGVDASAGERAAFCRELTQEMTARGVFVRPFGQTVGIAPPLVVSDDELDVIVQTLRAALRSLRD